MRLALKLHPDSKCDAVTGIEVEVARPRPMALVLRYLMTGKVIDVRLPPAAEPARADELWKHTCFEAFVQTPGGAGYCEFNIAPSRQWAAYRFSGYRRGMEMAPIEAPRIDVRATGESYELQVQLELGQLPDLSEASWVIGLSAVIEETNGRMSYWALAHPPGKPDFHHADCFALELPRA